MNAAQSGQPISTAARKSRGVSARTKRLQGGSSLASDREPSWLFNATSAHTSPSDPGRRPAQAPARIMGKEFSITPRQVARAQRNIAASSLLAATAVVLTLEKLRQFEPQSMRGQPPLGPGGGHLS